MRGDIVLSRNKQFKGNDYYIIQDDNAPVHRAGIVQDFHRNN